MPFDGYRLQANTGGGLIDAYPIYPPAGTGHSCTSPRYASAPLQELKGNGTTCGYDDTPGLWTAWVMPDSALRSTSPVKAYDSATDTPDVRSAAPPAPSLSDALSGLAQSLNGAGGEKTRAWIDAQLDPRCHADPRAAGVEVPDPLKDETPTHYTACLDTLGLEHAVTTLVESDADSADGDVVTTSPRPAEVVSSGSTVSVAKNPDQPIGSTPDPRCEPDGAETPSDPGPAPADGTSLPQYQGKFSYFATVDPTATPPASRDVPLAWGTTSWGWRHIKRGHGFSSADDADTGLALYDDAQPLLSYPSMQQYHYKHYYSRPDGSGGRLRCVRVVVVEYGNDRNGRFRGVTNSFSGLVVP